MNRCSDFAFRRRVRQSEASPSVARIRKINTLSALQEEDKRDTTRRLGRMNPYEKETIRGSACLATRMKHADLPISGRREVFHIDSNICRRLR
jgi:hypothetical protein